MATYDDFVPEFQLRSYEELSKEFREKISRAVELVPMMYNRLTLIDHLSHKQAMMKIFQDHIHIPGFSFRNMRRYLPLDNPMVPRRVGTTCPNSILTINTVGKKLNPTNRQNETNKHQPQNREVIQPMDYHELVTENAELKEVIRSQTPIMTADKIRSFEITFRIAKQKYDMVRVAMDCSKEFIGVIFDTSGLLERAESDVLDLRT